MEYINLNGPQGNAWVLMGYASKFAKQEGLDSNKIIDEMKSADYENLLSVFENYFGHMVELDRD